MAFDFNEHTHRRYNPLSGEWVLVSPHRTKRPWQGKVEKLAETRRPHYDPLCYLCPGNSRAAGLKNPDYSDVFVFTNDFSALVPELPEGSSVMGELFKASSERGLCRVICFSPKHDLTIPEMEISEIRRVIDVWCDQYKELGNSEFINYIQIFENKGDIMGCSNPHPHGQIWSQQSVPEIPARESKNQFDYYQKHKKTLLSDYLQHELEMKVRIVYENAQFVALVPFWAVWPYEIMIVSRRPISDLSGLTDEEKTSFADIYRQTAILYDNLFETSFPYSAGIHQAPTDGKEHPEWHIHMHFYPPLLRSATVKKFMVGYEMLAEPQRDITAEQSAEKLRALSKIHYLKN